MKRLSLLGIVRWLSSSRIHFDACYRERSTSSPQPPTPFGGSNRNHGQQPAGHMSGIQPQSALLNSNQTFTSVDVETTC